MIINQKSRRNTIHWHSSNGIAFSLGFPGRPGITIFLSCHLPLFNPLKNQYMEPEHHPFGKEKKIIFKSFTFGFHINAFGGVNTSIFPMWKKKRAFSLTRLLSAMSFHQILPPTFHQLPMNDDVASSYLERSWRSHPCPTHPWDSPPLPLGHEGGFSTCKISLRFASWWLNQPL